MYQEITIVGNVGREPRYRTLQSGQAVADFTVAVNKRRKNANGDQVEQTTWFDVTCWGKLAEIVDQYVTKGRQVLVVGEVAAEAWTDKNGEARASLKLTANVVKFLGGRGDEVAQSAGRVDELPEIPF